MMVNMMIS